MPKSSPLTLDLPKPQLVEAEGEPRVDPLQLLEGATVRVFYEGMLSTDSIVLRWESTPGEYAPIASLDGVEAGSVEFHVPPYYVGLRIDNFALFSYVVTRDGEEHPSPVADVFIKLPSNLPQLQIFQASGGVLDLSLLCGEDPVLHVDAWPFIDPVQVAQVYIGGIYPDGSKASLYPYEDAPVTEEDVRHGWTRKLSRAELATLKHDSELYIAFYVEFLPRADSRPVYRLISGLVLTLLIEPHLDLVAPTVVEATQITPENLVLNPVNTRDGATIRVSYEHMCPCDWVCAFWEGTAGAGTPVLECKQADNRDVVDFNVPASAISANFNKQVSVRYTVRREGQTWSALPRPVKILNISGLPKPQVEQATGSTLDLNTFQGDAQLTVAAYAYGALGQPCWMWVTGEREDGAPYRFDVLDGEPLSEEWLQEGVSTLLSRRDLQKLADCSRFDVHFAVNFDGRSDRASAEPFPVLHLDIHQEDLVLKPLTIREAVGSQLTVWNGRDGVTARVEYDHISAHDEISVCWTQSDGSCLPLPPKPGNTDPKYVDFTIPREAVIAGSGKTVPVSYSVASACKRVTSADLELQISVPQRLPAPEVPQATQLPGGQGTLDLRTFTGDAEITLQAWWFILAGQKGWLECTGTLLDGSSHTLKLLVNEPITQEQANHGLSHVLPREELEKFRHRSVLNIVFKVTADGSSHVSEAIVFPVLMLLLRKQYRDLTDFNDQTLGLWTVGSGAPDARDISIEYMGTGPDGKPDYAVRNFTFTNNSFGPILQRRFLDLESGFTYRFSVRVRRYSVAFATPKLSLRKDSIQQTPVEELVDLNWHTLSFTFTPTIAPVLLEIYSHEGATSGNDWYMDDFLVEGI
ncbi:hypothetical protein HX805_19740 [Pseudomonas sp. G5001]|uniref:hypothetical protein n=1 Tax=Pseudomonas sp. G5001 TaxID=2738824 RepID=UPI0015A0923C|nr:hypothetical protein [Pseudomonas sp. G5001]NWB74700.1 hypothetical protein [Pseudomonas sp. G5001]